MTKPNKYGSPFDPRNRFGGKIERPQETTQLRGCGDPNCNKCNPETASRGGTRSGRFSSSGRSIDIEVNMPGGNSATFRRMQEMMAARMMQSAFTDAGLLGEPYDSGNATYKKAREAVADYLISAPEQSFDDIVGNDEALAQLRDAVEAPVKHKDLYEAYGMTMPKGALLSGPPGCGKTMFARAAASDMKSLYGIDNFEFISISGSELQSMYVGETEGRIKAIFTFAREYRKKHGHPLLVFMDEADVLLPDRTGRVRRVASWEESQVATFLAEMDGMQESGAFVLLATNRPEVIDQAVLRDGRCDFKITVKRPTTQAIEVILSKGFEKLKARGAGVAELTFAAVETFSDPHKIILEAHAITVQEGKLADLGGKSFLLEHIVSGAMAASVPARAMRYAFNRDKESGTVSGVKVEDVVAAVNDLFEENRRLDHPYALDEFKAEFQRELEAEGRKSLN